MPDAKLTDLPAISVPSSADILYTVSSGASKSITIGNLISNLPNVVTTGSISVSGNINITGTSTIVDDSNRDYAWYVYDQISTNFIPNTGYPLYVNTQSEHTVLSSSGGTTLAVSANNIPSFHVIVPEQPNYPGFTRSFIQLGTANIVVSGAPGVTIGSLNSSLTSAGIYSKIDLTYIGDQLYTLTGDLSTSSM